MEFSTEGGPGWVPFDALVWIYAAILFLCVLFLGKGVPDRGLHLFFLAAVLLLVPLLARWEKPARCRWARLLRDWYPILLTPLFYKQLTYLIPYLHPRDYDPVLLLLDRKLFGLDPTVWLEHLTTPWLTEYLQIVYSTFYFLPLLVGIPIYRRRPRVHFQVAIFAVLLGFYSSYLGYLLVPALGPRFSISQLRSSPLHGVFAYNTLRRTLDQIEQITRDAFPSGHTEITLILVYLAFRYYRPLFLPMLWIGTSLILATVYLRYHYVVDVLSGALLALVCILAARRLETYLSRKGKS